MFDKILKKKQNNTKDLWQKYRGKPNTDDLLLEKAYDLAHLFPEVLKTNYNEVISYFDDKEISLDDRQIIELYKNLIFFNIHMLSRYTQSGLPYSQYSIFIDNFYKNVYLLLDQIFGNTIEIDKLINEQNEFEKEYSKYKPYSPEIKIMKNVLSWEFAKRLGKMLFLDKSEEIRFTLIYSTYFILPPIADCQIPELFSGEADLNKLSQKI